MSTATAFGDEPLIGLGACLHRAFRHALARKLRQLERITRLARVRMFATASRVASFTTTTVRGVFQRGGLAASASLLTAGSQIVTYAATAALRWASTLGTWTATVIGAHRSQATGLTRSLTQAPDPRTAAGIAVAAVLLTAVITISRLRRHPADERRGHQKAAATESLTAEERDRLSYSLYVVLGADGAVRVHGVPVTIAPEVRARIAQVAARAAEGRLEHLIARGRPLTELDMCAINVAARAAVTRAFEREDGGV